MNNNEIYKFCHIYNQRDKKYSRDAIIMNDPNRVPNYIQYCNKNNVTKVTIDNRLSSFSDFGFLNQLKNISMIEIKGDFNPTDKLDLPALKVLKTDTEKLNIHLSANPEVLITSNPKVLLNFVEKKSIRSVFIYGSYKKTTNTLKWIKDYSFPYVDTLRLTALSDQQFDWISSFRNLKVLSLIGNNTLKSISNIPSACPKISRLHIEACNGVDDLGVIAELSNLKYLRLNDMKSISSLAFIDSCQSLRTLIIDRSVIVDGDLTPIERLSEFAVYPIKSNYRITIDGDKKQIEEDLYQKSSLKRVYGDEDIDDFRRLPSHL